MSRGPVTPRGWASIGVKASQTLGGVLVGGGVQDTLRRSLFEPRSFPSVSRSVSGADISESAELTTGNALEVTWTLPGDAGINYSAAVRGSVGSGVATGTVQMTVNSIAFNGSFSSGAGGAVPGLEFASGGDEISIVVVPTFTGGGTAVVTVTGRAVGGRFSTS